MKTATASLPTLADLFPVVAPAPTVFVVVAHQEYEGTPYESKGFATRDEALADAGRLIQEDAWDHDEIVVLAYTVGQPTTMIMRSSRTENGRQTTFG